MSGTRPYLAWWAVFAIFAALLIAAIAWITVEMTALERAERVARAHAAHQEDVRLALWRMDSWLAPILAREAARAPRAYADPSATDTDRSSFVRDRFDGEGGGGGEHELPPAVVAVDLSACVPVLESEIRRAQTLERPEAERPVQRGGQTAQMALDESELQQRQRFNADNVDNRNFLDLADLDEVAGPLVAVWSGNETGEELLFVRRVARGGGERYQGFVCDWPRLCEALLGEVRDLLPDARLEPVPKSAEPARTMLATVPARVVALAPPLPAPAGFSVARLTLVVAWIAVALGLTAVALTLHASRRYAEKRARFASAVTHELRTPLTTFRMYSEMLAEGMIPDEATRREYVATLRSEADRLAGIVENVLAYTRLERGRMALDHSATTVSGLVERVRPALEHRASAAGMRLVVEEGSGAREVRLLLDLDAVGRILLNLVENACKYAAGAAERTIHVSFEIERDRLVVQVRDHGPGIAPEYARSIFLPFDRAGRDPCVTTPGIGLGLALTRGLARHLGGDLRFLPRADGACFELRLPTAQPG